MNDTDTPVKPASEQEQAAIAWLTAECERIAAITGTYISLQLGVQRTEQGTIYRQGHAYAGTAGTADGDTVTIAAERLIESFRSPDRPTLLRQQAAQLLAEADGLDAALSEADAERIEAAAGEGGAA